MASYVCLIQFRDQGIRNVQDTVKRGDAAMAEAEKMGMKMVEESRQSDHLHVFGVKLGSVGQLSVMGGAHEGQPGFTLILLTGQWALTMQSSLWRRRMMRP